MGGRVGACFFLPRPLWPGCPPGFLPLLSLFLFQSGCCLVQLPSQVRVFAKLRPSVRRDRSFSFFSAASSRETFFAYSFSGSSKISNHCSRMVTASLWSRSTQYKKSTRCRIPIRYFCFPAAAALIFRHDSFPDRQKKLPDSSDHL